MRDTIRLQALVLQAAPRCLGRPVPADRNVASAKDTLDRTTILGMLLATQPQRSAAMSKGYKLSPRCH